MNSTPFSLEMLMLENHFTKKEVELVREVCSASYVQACHLVKIVIRRKHEKETDKPN